MHLRDRKMVKILQNDCQTMHRVNVTYYSLKTNDMITLYAIFNQNGMNRIEMVINLM